MPQFPTNLPPSQRSNYQSTEELQRLAFQQPQRVRTTRLNPNVGDELSFEEESVVEPGWQKNAALQALKRQQDLQFSTEDADRTRVEGVRDLQQDANLSGFDNPMAKAGYERALAEEKLRLPIRQQQMIGDTQREVTRMQGENSLANTRLAGQQQIELQDRFNELTKMLQGGGEGNPAAPPVNRITLPNQRGGGSIGFDTNPQAQTQFNGPLLDRIREARASLATQSNPVTENNYNAAVSNALLDGTRKGIFSPPTAQLAMEIARDPQLRGLPWDQLQQHLEIDMNDPNSAKEQQELRMALMLVQGQ